MEAGKLELEQALFKLAEVLLDADLFALAAKKKGVAFVRDILDLYDGQLIGDQLRLRQVLANHLSDVMKALADSLSNAVKVLANFLSNAVKFTRQGSITLRIREEEHPQSIACDGDNSGPGHWL